MTSVTDIKKRISEILVGELDIKRVKSSTARNITSMPAALVITGPADNEREGSGMLTENRIYRLIVLIKTMAGGNELQAEEACEPYYDSIPRLFWERQSLESSASATPLESIQEVSCPSDGGFLVTNLAGVDYASIEFALSIKRFIEIHENT